MKIGNDKNLYELIKIISETNDADLVLTFEKTCQIYKNSSNLKVLKKIADDMNINLKFEAEDPLHKDYIEAVNNDNIEYTDNEISLDDEDSEEEVEVESKKRFKFPAIGIFSISRAKKDKSAGPSKMRKVLFGFLKIFIFLAVIFGVLFALWWYMPTSRVNLTVDSDVLVKLVDVRASSEMGVISAEEKVIPAVKIEVTESDSQSIPTTGEKEIGEKAEGEITIFNKTDDEITVKKGTVIKLISTDGDSYRYETKDKVDVPAREEITSDEEGNGESTYENGSKDVKIVAVSYGDEYNIGKDENFEIDDYDTDELIGENEDDIDGGTKETVFVVAQEDLDSLERQLDEFMREKVVDSLRRKVVDGQSLQESSIKYDLVSAEYDGELDDEAENLTYSMTVKGVGLAYNQSDLDAIIVDLTKTLIPEEYDLDETNPEYEVAATQGANDNEINIQVKIRSYITPKLDIEKISQDLTGMALNEAEKYLSEVNNVKAYTITVTPQLPGALLTMPHKTENISIEIEK